MFYTGGAPVIVKEPKLNISSTTIGSTYDMDEAPVFVVYYDNAEGTAAAENAKLTVYVDGTVNKEEDCGTLAVGATGLWKNMKFDLTNLTAGERQVYVSLTADGAEEAKTEVQTVTFTKAAPEATFELFVTDELTVEYGAESYSLVATVKNTSEIDAVTVEGEAAETLNDNTMTVPINVYESTGVINEELRMNNEVISNDIYDLCGRKLKNLKTQELKNLHPGLYIVSGRKMLVK